VDVGGAEAKFAGARADLDALGGVGFLELGCDFLRAVGGAVVDDDEFPVEVAGGGLLVTNWWDGEGMVQRTSQ
jgi:hypothetical protein